MIEKTEIFKVTVTGGLLDNLKAYAYPDFKPSKVEAEEEGIVQKYIEKAQAHTRYVQMCLNLQKGLDTLTDIVAKDADHLTVPSSISFKLIYTQPDGLWVEVDPSEYAEDEEIQRLRDGRVIFKGSKAIKRLIAKVLTMSHTSSETNILMDNIWDPEIATSGLIEGVRIRNIDIPAVFNSIESAEEAIEVERFLPGEAENPEEVQGQGEE